MMAYGLAVVTIVVIIGFSSVKTNDSVKVRQLCNSQKTCALCIGADVRCSWCYDNVYSQPRCDRVKTHAFHGCNKSSILDPTSKIVSVQNESLSDKFQKKILIKPQKIQLKIRPHDTVTIPVKFYTTKDYAVDMYFLMDLSYTMKQYIEELSLVSMELVENIKNLTGSLQVGIGSFVDKIILPYGYCAQEEKHCGYSFKQRVRLTNNFTQFKETVSKLQKMTTSNFDEPEGGLDALMQAVVCGDKIGWRKNSRKVIIYCSDAPFHFAGDGQLGGIVVPNDGKCHMNNDAYTKEYSQDYPSVEHIAKVVQQNKITVIFAVAGQEFQALYHLLSQGLISSFVNDLGNKNSTIANIVTEGYKNITSTVEMKATSNNNFKVDFVTNCTNGEWVKSKKCRGIKLGEVVNFQAVITAPECEKRNQSNTQTIKIHPINSDAQLEIDVELICKCDCKEKVLNSSMCNGNGLWHCGECTCNEGFSGQRCECDKTTHNIKQTCFARNSTKECSGRGSCECGACVCHSMASNTKHFYSGTYCECDDYSCLNYNGLLCGGPSRGKCECGHCKCRPEYEGEDCHCPTSQETCRSENHEICNGHGTCECGVCICDEDSGFFGDTCENCPTCNNWCEINKKCVKCWKSKDGGSMLECGRSCKINVTVVENMATEHSSEDISKVCKVEIRKCIIQYQTVIQNGTKQLLILKKEECPESKTTGMIIGIVVGILILGLIVLIIWKIVTTFLDRWELARFNEEKAKSAWTIQMNPLFIQSSTTYENPTWVLNE